MFRRLFGVRPADAPESPSHDNADERIRQLKDLIRRLLVEVEEHNAEYKHQTPQSLIDEARRVVEH